ncbi:MAG: Na+:solute symporter [Crocinitomicaceae bacterium]|nr:Na+:solute symporter [Crocinitomicaceae bacterium]
MVLSALDWGIIIGFFLITLLIGVLASKQAGKSSGDFFLSGRNMPWWLLGVSMVATTFAADTPNFVTGVIRGKGIAGNWDWWAFLITGMVTVFIYSRLWRKLGISTDLEFYEIRYKGKAAGFLRGFRAIYLGVVFNVFIMATVCMAGVKIGHVTLGLSAFETLGIACVVTVLYSLLGGLRGVILTDFFQFIIAMVGSVAAAYFIIDMPEVGGMDGLLNHEVVKTKLDFIPDREKQPDLWYTVFLIPLAVQWWSSWYPGAEPGGGGYVAQRMLSAKDEKHATKATLFFNFAHYALRPWPWILIALASIIVFPEVSDLKSTFPGLQESYYADDLAYPAMLTYLPAGLLGLVMASLISAFMSTISTHLNWGSSYVVNDFYKRFIRKDAKEKRLVAVGRISTVIMMLLAALLSMVLSEAEEAFKLIVQIGAGTGLLFILRWFWKAINPWSEIAAMISSFTIAMIFFIIDKVQDPNLPPEEVFSIPGDVKLFIGVGLTTLVWVVVTLITKNDEHHNPEFEKRAFGEDGNGLKHMGLKILNVFVGSLGIYAALFGVGAYLLDKGVIAGVFLGVFISCCLVIYMSWKKITS